MEFNLTGSSVNCLFYLHLNPQGLTVSELAAACEEDKAAVSRNVNHMVRLGYAFFDEKFGKKYRAKVSLTEAGMAVARKLDRCINEAVEYGGQSMTEEERSIFYRCFNGVFTNLRRYIAEVLNGDPADVSLSKMT